MSSDNERITQEVDSRLDDLFGEEDGGGDMPDGGMSADNAPDEPSAPSAELNNRLDDFFEGDSAPKKEADNPAPKKASPIEELKSVILSLEWEITDQVMQKLGEEILKLERIYDKDKIVVAFLQLLGSLGKYIRKKRAEAHPDSITLLQSVFDNLEHIINTSGISDAEKKKMLVLQVNSYKKLKEDIVVSKAPAPDPPRKREVPQPDIEEEEDSSEEEESMEPGHHVMPEPEDDAEDEDEPEYYDESTPNSEQHQELIAVLEAIHETIRSEFSALREELKKMRNTQE